MNSEDYEKIIGKIIYAPYDGFSFTNIEMRKLYSELESEIQRADEIRKTLILLREDYLDAIVDRDDWKKRAQALEQAINFKCEYCKHITGRKIIMEKSDSPCNECCWWEHWQFDYDRFAETT